MNVGSSGDCVRELQHDASAGLAVIATRRQHHDLVWEWRQIDPVGEGRGNAPVECLLALRTTGEHRELRIRVPDVEPAEHARAAKASSPIGDVVPVVVRPILTHIRIR